MFSTTRRFFTELSQKFRPSQQQQQTHDGAPATRSDPIAFLHEQERDLTSALASPLEVLNRIDMATSKRFLPTLREWALNQEHEQVLTEDDYSTQVFEDDKLIDFLESSAISDFTLQHVLCWLTPNQLRLRMLRYCFVEELQEHKSAWELLTMRTNPGRWTPLHMAVNSGNIEQTKLILERFASLGRAKEGVEIQDESGNTSLAMACSQGRGELVEMLLESGSDPTVAGGKAQRGALFHACAQSHASIVRTLLSHLVAMEVSPADLGVDVSGYGPLHAACFGKNLDTLQQLIDFDCDINAQARDRSTPLHVAARLNRVEMAKRLLECGANMSLLTSFGTTPLHVAARNGSVELCKVILQFSGPSVVHAQDYDGQTPLHALSQLARLPEGAGGDAKEFHQLSITDQEQAILTIANMLLDGGADVDARDYGGGTALMMLCWSATRHRVISLAQELIRRGANPTLESHQGWNCLHIVLNTANDGNLSIHSGLESEVQRGIGDRMQEGVVDKSFMDSFQQDKQRDLSNKKYLSQRGPENRIPIEDRQALLQGDHTLSGITTYLKRKLSHDSKRPPRVVVLAGAGISTSCGIPDFRSKTGLYSDSSTANLFTYAGMVEHPKAFYNMVRQLFFPDGAETQPSPTHKFLRKLQDEGLLCRVYTQNVDMLERKAGVDAEKIVEAHGTFSAATCTNESCGEHYGAAEDSSSERSMQKVFWDKVREGDEVPTCLKCGNMLRPDVVFFGEGMPAHFSAHISEDFKECDLLIVIGTSLIVYPFAGLANEVTLLTPRLLINKEPTGPFKHINPETNYRDVAHTSDCDSAAELFCRQMGWQSN